VTCPHCGEEADFEGYRPLNHVRTLVGEIVYERAYYACGHCHQGHCPTDAEFHLESEQTRGYREVLALAGVHEGFAECAERMLHRLSGVTASASTVQRVTEVVGEMISRVREESVPLQEAPCVWSWNLDANGKKVACLSLDLTSVAQQGAHGEKREGRMPVVGSLFNPASATAPKTRQSHEVHDIHYVAGLMPLEQMSHQLRDEAQAVGLAAADVVLVLLDGGAGLEDCALNAVSGLSRETVLILDFHHAHDHLVEFAKVYHEEATSRAALVSQWSDLLKEHGGKTLLETLSALDLTDRSETVRESHRQLLGYIRHNVHRMDYPTDLKNGWPIGSGVIESACKRVIAKRLKAPGMRWREPGTNSLAHARSLYLSSDHRWQFFWSHIAGG
jgi:hypothetical protein